MRLPVRNTVKLPLGCRTPAQSRLQYVKLRECNSTNRHNFQNDITKKVRKTCNKQMKRRSSAESEDAFPRSKRKPSRQHLFQRDIYFAKRVRFLGILI